MSSIDLPLATADPSPMPTPTTVPTLDRQTVAEIVATGRANLDVRKVDPLCLRWEDTDGDQQPEWLGLYLRQTDPPRLEGFVLDGGTWYDLRTPEGEEYGLGEYAVCQLELRDINIDGITEILVWGAAQRNIALFHAFVWQESQYELLASFQSDASIHLRDGDGDLSEEIIARYDAGDGLAWETVHTWDGSHYGWTWEQYDWFHRDHPHAYLDDTPPHAVISFYLALDDRDLPGAYGLLTSETQTSQPYEAWAANFHTTLAWSVGSVYETERAPKSALVTAQVRSYRNRDGYVFGSLWDVTWTVVRDNDTWRLHRERKEKLEEWEAPYFW